MHIYPLRCCLDSLYVVGAVNNGARLRKLPILIRNRIDAIFRHRPLRKAIPAVNTESEVRFRFKQAPRRSSPSFGECVANVSHKMDLRKVDFEGR